MQKSYETGPIFAKFSWAFCDTNYFAKIFAETKNLTKYYIDTAYMTSLF
jgi:hypothetical protein